MATGNADFFRLLTSCFGLFLHIRRTNTHRNHDTTRTTDPGDFCATFARRKRHGYAATARLALMIAVDIWHFVILARHRAGRPRLLSLRGTKPALNSISESVIQLCDVFGPHNTFLSHYAWIHYFCENCDLHRVGSHCSPKNCFFFFFSFLH